MVNEPMNENRENVGSPQETLDSVSVQIGPPPTYTVSKDDNIAPPGYQPIASPESRLAVVITPVYSYGNWTIRCYKALYFTIMTFSLFIIVGFFLRIAGLQYRYPC